VFLFGLPDAVSCLDEGHLLDAMFILHLKVRPMVYDVGQVLLRSPFHVRIVSDFTLFLFILILIRGWIL